MSIARGAKQLLSLLRCLNTCPGQRKIGLFFTRGAQKSPVFSSENRRDLSGNGILPISLVPLHLQTGFRSFSVIPQGLRDKDFSELDAKEMNEGEGFKEAVTNKMPSLTSIFSNKYEKKSVKSVTSNYSDKNEKKSVNSVTSISSKITEKKNGKSEQQQEKKKNEKSEQQQEKTPMTKERDERNYSNKNEKQSVKSVTSISSKLTEKKNRKSKQQQEKTPMTKKAEGVLDILEHPWPEWVRFIEYLNERGYLSKAFHFQGPIELQGLSTEGIYAFIKFAAFSFAEDHFEISKLIWLSGSDLKNIALYCFPSVDKQVVLAAKRLRSLYSAEDDASLPSNVDDTSNPPSVESEVKRLEMEDVVRLLCAYGLNAEKSELPIPDDIKQSVVNLLKELVDISASSVIDG